LGMGDLGGQLSQQQIAQYITPFQLGLDFLGTTKEGPTAAGEGIGGMLGGLGGLAGGAASLVPFLSDARVKQHIKHDTAKIRAFLDTLHPQEFEYIQKPGDKHYGVMAQDLQESEVGESMVIKTPEGELMVHGGMGLSAVLAALGDINKRLASLEAKLAD